MDKQKSTRKKIIILCILLAAFFAIWFAPQPEGLTPAAQHSMALIVLTVGIWASGAVPAGVGTLVLIGIATTFMQDELPPAVLLKYWESDTMWFILMCFSFGAVIVKSGLGKRLATMVFSIRRLIVVDLLMWLLTFLLSVAGMSISPPKLTLLLPLLVSIAAASGLDKTDKNVRHVALMITFMANLSGLTVYSGYFLNTTVGNLGGFPVDYGSWIKMFFVPCMLVNIVVFFIVYFLFRPEKGSGFDSEAAKKMHRELGPLCREEIKTIIWLGIAVILWSTGGITGIKAGWAAVLVTAGMCMPVIGILTFEEYCKSVNWNTVFLVMGVNTFGAFGSTGLTEWVWTKLLPSTLPQSPIVLIMLLSALCQVLHVPLGSCVSCGALVIPSLSALSPVLGFSPQLLSIVAYLSINAQAFFPYQGIAFVSASAFGLWSGKDLLKVGIATFIAIPITLGLLLYPYWKLMGWIP